MHFACTEHKDHHCYGGVATIFFKVIFNNVCALFPPMTKKRNFVFFKYIYIFTP